jgi:hypothetical protein
MPTHFLAQTLGFCDKPCVPRIGGRDRTEPADPSDGESGTVAHCWFPAMSRTRRRVIRAGQDFYSFVIAELL